MGAEGTVDSPKGGVGLVGWVIGARRCRQGRLEGQVGIDRHWKMDTIGHHDKQGKLDALGRRFGLRGIRAMDWPGVSARLKLHEVWSHESVFRLFQLTPIQGSDGIA